MMFEGMMSVKNKERWKHHDKRLNLIVTAWVLLDIVVLMVFTTPMKKHFVNLQ